MEEIEAVINEERESRRGLGILSLERATLSDS